MWGTHILPEHLENELIQIIPAAFFMLLFVCEPHSEMLKSNSWLYTQESLLIMPGIESRLAAHKERAHSLYITPAQG